MLEKYPLTFIEEDKAGTIFSIFKKCHKHFRYREWDRDIFGRYSDLTNLYLFFFKEIKCNRYNWTYYLISFPPSLENPLSFSWFKFPYPVFSFLSFFFCVIGVWTQDFTLTKRYFTTWATPPGNSALVILEMGSHILFAHAGLELLSSLSQSLK
jgi:hypothetical protein